MNQLALDLSTPPETDPCPTCRRNDDGATAETVDGLLIVRDGEVAVLCVGCEEPIGPSVFLIANGIPVTATGPEVFDLTIRSEDP